jgi:hypothetical protein
MINTASAISTSFLQASRQTLGLKEELGRTV